MSTHCDVTRLGQPTSAKKNNPGSRKCLTDIADDSNPNLSLASSYPSPDLKGVHSCGILSVRMQLIMQLQAK